MKQVFEIKDKKVIQSVLDDAEYGTLALCTDGLPYSVPVNFVTVNDVVYFHGSHKGRKMSMIDQNPKVSFSVVENYSLIQSYFSSSDGLACPATQFFKSVIIDGEALVVEDAKEKAMALEALMQKLQPEGKYIPLSDEVYEKALKGTAVMKIVASGMKAKFKFGQHLNEERFEMILKHLEERGEVIDLETVALMKQMKNNI
ncbi:MAG: pyridoxamine 5'-phosphate oxidase family protein [Sulfurovum sp.]|nr:MAG: pyridoxamine 5'-phosphate oxidase family protein [Sulfurovum sp.]